MRQVFHWQRILAFLGIAFEQNGKNIMVEDESAYLQKYLARFST